MSHLVLLGDSVFDNSAYVDPGEPDVADQLRSLLSSEDEVTLLAVDGHLTSDVPSQITAVPDSATHLVLSVGGNDALGYLDVIEGMQDQPVRFPEAIAKLQKFQTDLREKYEPVMGQLVEMGLPTALCTVYNGNFELQMLQDMIDTILPVINDVIREVALRHGLPLIDLGRALGEPDLDYANPIEPSAHGGEKIARVIRAVLRDHDFESGRTSVYT